MPVCVPGMARSNTSAPILRVPFATHSETDTTAPAAGSGGATADPTAGTAAGDIVALALAVAVVAVVEGGTGSGEEKGEISGA